MFYRRFGRTKIQMPVLTCGGMRYQESWNDIPLADVPKANQENLEATIQRAIKLGINHIETARGYGSSEMQLGLVLPQLPREQITVQSKIGPEEDPKKFLENFEKSLSYLKLDYLDLLSIHGINNQELLDLTLRPGGCLSVAEELRKQSRCRHIGFSTHASLDVIRKTIATDAFDYVNLHWYFVNEFNWPAILDAKKHDMGVFIISPNDKGGLLYKPSEKLTACCQPLSPMHFNNLFCLQRPEVHTLSIGASKPSDFDEHIRSLEDYLKIEEVIHPIEKNLRETLDQVLGAEWMRSWFEGLPTWEEVPQEINIVEILRLWNYAHGLDMVEYGQMRYNLLGNGGHWFAGKQATDLDRVDLNACLQNSKFKKQIPALLQQAHELLAGEAKKRLSQS